MKYDDRVEEERKVAASEGRETRYLQPNAEELREVLMTGELYGKCLRCKKFGKALKDPVTGKYKCVHCNA